MKHLWKSINTSRCKRTIICHPLTPVSAVVSKLIPGLSQRVFLGSWHFSDRLSMIYSEATASACLPLKNGSDPT